MIVGITATHEEAQKKFNARFGQTGESAVKVTTQDVTRGMQKGLQNIWHGDNECRMRVLGAYVLVAFSNSWRISLDGVAIAHGKLPRSKLAGGVFAAESCADDHFDIYLKSEAEQ